MDTYIQREISSQKGDLTRVPITTAPTPAQQPNVKKKPGLSYFVVEKGVVVSKVRPG